MVGGGKTRLELPGASPLSPTFLQVQPYTATFGQRPSSRYRCRKKMRSIPPTSRGSHGSYAMFPLSLACRLAGPQTHGPQAAKWEERNHHGNLRTHRRHPEGQHQRHDRQGRGSREDGQAAHHRDRAGRGRGHPGSRPGHGLPEDGCQGARRRHGQVCRLERQGQARPQGRQRGARPRPWNARSTSTPPSSRCKSPTTRSRPTSTR